MPCGAFWWLPGTWQRWALAHCMIHAQAKILSLHCSAAQSAMANHLPLALPPSTQQCSGLALHWQLLVRALHLQPKRCCFSWPSNLQLHVKS